METIALNGLRYFIAITLLASGAAKLGVMNWYRFLRILRSSYRWFPFRLTWPLAVAMPYIEMLTGIILLFRSTALLGELAAAGLYLTFSLAVSISILRGRKGQPCGCGFGGRLSWWLACKNAGFGFLMLWVAIKNYLQYPG